MDNRPSTPTRPPEYLPLYGHDDDHTPVGHETSAAVRLLTSIADQEAVPDPYVKNKEELSLDSLVPAPLSLYKKLSLHGTYQASETSDQCLVSTSLPQQRTSLVLPRCETRSAGRNAAFSPSVSTYAKQAQVRHGGPSTPSRSQHWPSVQLNSLTRPGSNLQAQSPLVLDLLKISESSLRKRNHLKEASPARLSCKPVNLQAPPIRILTSNKGYSIRTHRPVYQSSIGSLHSQRSSILDPPSMPPPDDYYMGRDGGSPGRPWSPSHSQLSSHLSSNITSNLSSHISSEYSRPPPSNAHYEPSDLNGSPRPGTPSSQYGGSPRRPLPPAPLFGVGGQRNSRFQDDATISISLDDQTDPFGPESDLSEARPDSYISASSQDTLSDETDAIMSKVEHYGPAPNGKQERRGVRAPQMSRREVQLINGELVLECKIPTILYSFLPRRDEIEFTHMRYTAVTCDPDDFVERGYKLRQNIGRTMRETELLICVTMYNENEFDFTRTMHAIMKNISHFCGRNKSRTWGENGWQKIVVCIISDGREKIHPRTLDALAAMGVYQHGIAKNYINSKAVQAHVYEYSTQVSLDSDLKFKGAEKGIVPCQIIFCLKERNMRKLNSHRWCFNAFAKALNPNVCILLDVGTRPGNNSLYHLWKAFDSDSNVAGACGEIKAMKGKLGANLLNPLVASQNFEYKMSNILDKPLESVFGYITVLPGALSAYRYHALQNDETGHGPLSQYFKGETLHGQHADVFTANMYLAEDRILCWELVAKRNESWVLKYVKGCTGETDVPGK